MAIMDRNFAKRLSARKGVIAQTYLLLAVQLLVTFAIIWRIRKAPEVAKRFCTTAALLGSFVLLLALIFVMYWVRGRAGAIGQIAVLALFTVALAMSLQCITSRFELKDVRGALISMLLVFAVMTVAGYLTILAGVDLGFMGWVVLTLLVGLIVFGLVSLFVPMSSKVKKAYHAIAIVLFAFLVAMDTNQMVYNTYTSAAENALGFYLDSINIFSNLLLSSSD